MNTPRFRFGENEVDPATRQLTHAGRVLRTEPKVFDVLVLLLRARHRVVKKQELLDAVWAGTIVTDGVIARAVMKVRKLIGDTADDPAIQTIPRVGYRFTAEVEEVLPPSPSVQAWGADPVAAPGRIAVLPFVNGTGDPRHAWIDLGLMSTVVDALACALGAAGVVPVTELLAALGDDDAALPLETVAATLGAALGPLDVVQATLSDATRSGEYVLRVATTGAALAGWGGTCEGPDPLSLSHLLARRVGDRLSPVRAPDTRLPESADARFAEAARARGLQALAEERWGNAARLLRVALDLLHDDPDLQLDLAQCQVARGDAPALPQLQAGHHARELRALQLIASWHHDRGELVEAERLLAEGLRIAESAGLADAELPLLLASARTLTSLDKPAVASWMLDRAAPLATRLGSPGAHARLLDARGLLALYRHEGARAEVLFEQAAQLGAQHGLAATTARSLVHRGHCLRDLGRTAQAAATYLQALDHAERTGHPVLVGLSGVCSVRHASAEAADTLLARMRAAAALPAAIELADAFARGRRGQWLAALAALDRAEAGIGRSPSFGLHLAVLRIRILVRLGRLDEALDLCDGLRARAAGRLQRQMLGASLHLRALAAAADGSDDTALALLHESLRAQGPSIARTDALLDAVWLHLKTGARAEARALLDEAAPFMQAALESGHAPALRVQAAWLATEAGRAMPGDPDACGLPSLVELQPARARQASWVERGAAVLHELR